MHVSKPSLVKPNPPNDLTLAQTLEIFNACYRSIEVRSLIARYQDKDEWVNVCSVVRFTKSQKEDIEAQHKLMSEKLRSIDTERLRLLITVLPATGADSFMKSLDSGSIQLNNIRFRRKGNDPISSQRLYQNYYFIEKNEYVEYPLWASLTSTPNTIGGFLREIGINLERLGLPSDDDVTKSFLEITGSNLATDVLVAIPIYMKFLALSLIGTKLLKFSAEVHKSLLGKVRFDLIKKAGGLLDQSKRLNAKECKAIPNQDMIHVEGQESFQELKNGDIVSVRCYLPEIGIMGEMSGAVEKELKSVTKGASEAVSMARDPRKVFVVYGRNEELRMDLFQFLRALDLDPIEFSEAIKLTGKTSPYIGEILDAAFRSAQAVIVLMSPDDEARLRAELRKENDPEYEKKLAYQPRQNVLFEAGMAFAYDPEHTILVKVGNLRPFTDTYGRHEVRLTNEAESRQELVTRLMHAGCSVKTGRTDWLKIGNFDIEVMKGAEEAHGETEVEQISSIMNETELVLTNTDWMILEAAKGSFADVTSTTDIARATGLDDSTVYQECVILRDNGFLVFTDESFGTALLKITGQGLVALRRHGDLQKESQRKG